MPPFTIILPGNILGVTLGDLANRVMHMLLIEDPIDTALPEDSDACAKVIEGYQDYVESVRDAASVELLLSVITGVEAQEESILYYAVKACLLSGLLDRSNPYLAENLLMRIVGNPIINYPDHGARVYH